MYANEFAMAYILTGNETSKKNAEIIMNSAMGNLNYDDLFVNKQANVVYRDSMARFILYSYINYKLLNNKDYLLLADKVAVAMVEKLKREESTFTPPKENFGGGVPQTQKLFYSTYDGNPPYTAVEGKNNRDNNQNAEIALAFLLLSKDRNSIFYKDSYYKGFAKDIIKNELSSTYSQQDKTTGEIDLTEWLIGNHESGHASYTVSSWYWIYYINKDPDLRKHLLLAKKWFSTLSKEPNLAITHPVYHPAFDHTGWFRLGALSIDGFNKNNFVDLMYSSAMNNVATGASTNYYENGAPITTNHETLRFAYMAYLYLTKVNQKIWLKYNLLK